MKSVKPISLAMVLMSLCCSQMAVASSGHGNFSGVSTKGNLSVWRVNHNDGAVSLCSFEGHINEPVCYPWSAGAKGKGFSIIPGDDVLSTGKGFSIIPGDDVLSTWRINAENGAVSLCEYKEVSDPPVCTPWSQD